MLQQEKNKEAYKFLWNLVLNIHVLHKGLTSPQLGFREYFKVLKSYSVDFKAIKSLLSSPTF